jgi:hypothetical protein
MRFKVTSALFSSLVVLFAVASVPVASSQDIFVTPIPGVPFGAKVAIERSEIAPDGSIQALKTWRAIARDGHGRIHNEATELIPVSSDETPGLIRAHLYDPQTRVSTMVFLQNHTYSQMTVNRPPATVPPRLVFAAPNGDTIPPSEFAKKTDLGTREIEGVLAHGIREEQTIQAENGDAKDVVVTDEYWYSEELRIHLLIKHNDPRMGSVTLKVYEITRGEPDPTMFQIPPGYKPAGQDAGQ